MTASAATPSKPIARANILSLRHFVLSASIPKEPPVILSSRQSVAKDGFFLHHQGGCSREVAASAAGEGLAAVAGESPGGFRPGLRLRPSLGVMQAFLAGEPGRVKLRPGISAAPTRHRGRCRRGAACCLLPSSGGQPEARPCGSGPETRGGRVRSQKRVGVARDFDNGNSDTKLFPKIRAPWRPRPARSNCPLGAGSNAPLTYP